MSQSRKPNVPQKPDLGVPTSHAYNWKDHPLVIATASVVSAIGFTIFIYQNLIIPALTNQVLSLSTEVSSLSTEVSSLRELKENADKELAALQTQLAESQNANLFSLGNPYPVGLGKIRVGDPISSLDTFYSEKDIEKNENGWSIHNKHNIFDHIIYYFDEESPKKPITNIFFISYRLGVPSSFLQYKLIEALGTPKQWQKKDFFSWTTQAKVTVYKFQDSGFMVMANNVTPSIWPEK